MLPLGSMGYENQINERGERLIWLAPNVINRLRAMRGRITPTRPCVARFPAPKIAACLQSESR